MDKKLFATMVDEDNGLSIIVKHPDKKHWITYLPVVREPRKADELVDLLNKTEDERAANLEAVKEDGTPSTPSE